MATYTVAGDVASFDEATFKYRLAASLEGVDEADISLLVQVASVKVTATITTPSTATRDATLNILTSLAASTADASAALGVTIEAASTPQVTLQIMTLAPPPAPPSGRGQVGLMTIVIAGVAGGVGGAVLILIIVASYCYCKRRGSKDKVQEAGGIRYRGSQVPTPPPAAVVSTVPSHGMTTEKV